MPTINKRASSKKTFSIKQKIDKINQDFFVKMSKIEKDRNIKISKIIKKIEAEKIKNISASLKK